MLETYHLILAGLCFLNNSWCCNNRCTPKSEWLCKTEVLFNFLHAWNLTGGQFSPRQWCGNPGSFYLVILHLQYVTPKVIACLFQAVKLDGVEREFVFYARAWRWLLIHWLEISTHMSDKLKIAGFENSPLLNYFIAAVFFFWKNASYEQSTLSDPFLF